VSIQEVKNIFAASPFFNHIGFQITRFEAGEVVMELPVKEHLINANNAVHGGVYASMLDTIMGMTIRSIVEFPLTTINLNINYLAPSTEGILVAKGKVIQQGYRIITAEGEITDQEGKLLAKGIGTFKVLRGKADLKKCCKNSPRGVEG
jgi:uncharacterized protein (TIGR00369 family)